MMDLIKRAEKLNYDHIIRIRDVGSDKTLFFLGSCRMAIYAEFFMRDPRFSDYNISYIVCYLPVWEKMYKGEEPFPEHILKDFCCAELFFCEMMHYRWNLLQTNDVTQGVQRLGANPRKYIYLPNLDAGLYNYDIKIAIGRLPEADEVRVAVESGCEKALVEFRDTQLERLVGIVADRGYTDAAEYLKDNYRTRRLMWTINHPSTMFLHMIYKEFMRKVLDMEPCPNAELYTEGPDMFSENCTVLDKVDRDVLLYRF